MRTFLIKIVCLTILSVFTIGIFYWGLMQIKDPRVSQNELSFAVEALHIMQESQKPKIVVISGSNGAYGIYSPILKDSFNNMQVINAGVHAGIGIHFMLELYQPELHQGDVVLLMPEWDHFTDMYNGNSTVIKLLSSIYPHGCRLLDTQQWLHLQQYIPIHAKDALMNGNKKVNPTELSSIHSKNKYGDVIYPRHKSIYHSSQPLKSRLDSRAFDLVSQFMHDCQKKGIHVLLLPPTFQQTSFLESQKTIYNIVHRMESQNTPFMAPPGRYVFPDSLFYNSVYHLTTSGAELRTQLLIEDIHRLLPELK